MKFNFKEFFNSTPKVMDVAKDLEQALNIIKIQEGINDLTK